MMTPRLLSQRLDRATLAALVKRRTGRWLFAVASEWCLIGLTLAACNAWPSIWLWVLGGLFIGTRQHALGILVHEGAHHLVHRNRTWNNLLSNYLAAFPIWISTEGYRESHLHHHWYLETERDPSRITLDFHASDWTFPMSRRRFYLMMLRDLTGISQASSLSLMKYLWEIPGGARWLVLQLLLVQGTAIALAAAGGYLWSYALLWLVPLFTVAMMCYRLRSVAEHSAVGDPALRFARKEIDVLGTTRTTLAHPLVRFLLVPYSVSYHIEHHLYPAVPCFALPALHDQLVTVPQFSAEARLTRSHGQLMAELTASPEGPFAGRASEG